MNRIKRHTKQVIIAVLGGSVVLIGAVLIPYPGPGWLIVFAGLAILATEFAFAGRLLERLRIKYEQWVNWLKRQHRSIQVVALCGTGLVVLVTVWLLNSFGLLNTVFDLGQDWLISPFFR
jgi:uncharacterized protein (TIGR02611 family)